MLLISSLTVTRLLLIFWEERQRNILSFSKPQFVQGKEIWFSTGIVIDEVSRELHGPILLRSLRQKSSVICLQSSLILPLVFERDQWQSKREEEYLFSVNKNLKRCLLLILPSYLCLLERSEKCLHFPSSSIPSGPGPVVLVVAWPVGLDVRMDHGVILKSSVGGWPKK